MKNEANSPSRIGEHNDCAVVALANVLGIPYIEAHQMLARQGRKNRRGTKTWMSEKALRANAANVEKIIPSIPMRRAGLGITTRPTVAQVERQLLKTARYWIAAGGHAFAYVNGQHLDNNSRMSRARVKVIYKITLKTSSLSQAQINELWARLDKLEGK